MFFEFFCFLEMSEVVEGYLQKKIVKLKVKPCDRPGCRGQRHMEYIHQEGVDVKEEIVSISGHYTIEKEKKLKYGDRTVLCVIGSASIDSSCCGVGGCRYALVPGYVQEWKKTENKMGLPISVVEPILDENAKKEITDLLKKEEVITQIEFW